LSDDAQRQLLELEDYFATNYARTSIGAMLDGYRSKRAPTLKEATTLVAATQNLARKADTAILSEGAGTTSAVDHIAILILRERLLLPSSKFNALTKLWDKGIDTRSRKIRAFLEQGGLTTATDGISAPLSADFIERFVALTREEARTFLAT
jgi:hypothetical protein